MALSPEQKRFLIRFPLLLLLFYVVVTPPAVDRWVIAPFSHALAVVSGGVLNMLGESVTVTGTVISGGAFGVDIKNGCNGIEAIVFLCAAIVAFGGSWRARLIGIGASCLAIEALNVIRIVTLYWIGRHRQASFDTFHLAVWQTIIFAAAVFLFTVWTAYARRPHAVATP